MAPASFATMQLSIDSRDARYRSESECSEDSDCSTELVSSAASTDAEFDAAMQPPRLLGRVLSSDMSVCVKNTFISVDVSSDEEDEEFGAMPMVKSKTWSCRQGGFLSNPLGAAAPQELSSGDEEAAAEEIVPLEHRQPEESIGSSLHASQRCKPCCWYWRPQGCNFGKECRHCHTCLAGELKRRRKVKKVLRRAAAEQPGPSVFLAGEHSDSPRFIAGEQSGSCGFVAANTMEWGANAIVLAVPAAAFGVSAPVTSAAGVLSARP